AGNRRGEGRCGVPGTGAPGPPASNRRFSRRTCRTVIRRAAATWALVSRPPHSAFDSPGRCSSFRLNVKVSIDGGPFHGAVRGGHFHVAAACRPRWLDHRPTRVLGFSADATTQTPSRGRDRHARGKYARVRVTRDPMAASARFAARTRGLHGASRAAPRGPDRARHRDLPGELELRWPVRAIPRGERD